MGKGEESKRKKKELNPKDKAWICNFYSFSTFYISVYESKFKKIIQQEIDEILKHSRALKNRHMSGGCRRWSWRAGQRPEQARLNEDCEGAKTSS